MTTHQGYTVIAAVLALIAAAMIWTVGRARWPRTVVLLIIAGVGGLASTTAGRWAHQGIAAAANAMGRLTGYLFGFVFAGIITLVAVGLVGFHLHHKTISKRTLGAAAVVPLSASLLPGAVGTILVGVVGFLVGLAGEVFFVAFHGHL